MTICVAALCEDCQTIVIATDQMISNDFAARESGIEKFAHINEKWGFAFAATDVTPLAEIMRAATVAFKDHDGTVEDAQSLFVRVYQNIRLKRAEAKFLAPRGYTLEQFKNEGRKLLGEMIFASIENHIFEFRLGVTLLVAGFDSRGTGHIFTVDHPGLSQDRGVPGFHAIGSGSFNATNALYQRNLNPASYLPPVIYYVYEAKKYAEANGAVGEKTFFSIFRSGSRQEAMGGKLAKLEAIWNMIKPRDLDNSMVADIIGDYPLLKNLPKKV